MSFIVAIDGPAGAGKGTITKIVGEKLNLLNVDTGAMYRCVALQMVRNDIKIDELDKIKEILETIDIKLVNKNGIINVFLDGEDVTNKIRTEEISRFVSPVSTVKIIREKMVELQRKYGEEQNIIMEGRDIGTEVFPNADVKIYLDATSEERARRRMIQNEEKGIKCEYEEILKEIKIRDERDSTREVSPLKKAEDAILVDSTNMTIEEVVNEIVKIIQNVTENKKR